MLEKFILSFTSIFLVLVVSCVLAYPVMLIWNGAMVFAFPFLGVVSWLQMWGVLVFLGHIQARKP